MQNERTIILHYHLFKNAGTSIDSILKENFGDRWVTKEFKNSPNTTPDVEQWILDNPNAVAFSSHTMNGPLPKIEGTEIISIMMLRNPIKRIISAYKFERMQNANTWGSQLARQLSFEEYVVTRLKESNDNQCRNFQTDRLATLRPGEESSIRRAMSALDDITLIGIVEHFDKSLEKIALKIRETFPDYDYESTHSNKSKLFDFELSPALDQLLEECNKADLRLWKFAKKQFNQQEDIVASPVSTTSSPAT